MSVIRKVSIVDRRPVQQTPSTNPSVFVEYKIVMVFDVNNESTEHVIWRRFSQIEQFHQALQILAKSNHTLSALLPSLPSKNRLGVLLNVLLMKPAQSLPSDQFLQRRQADLDLYMHGVQRLFNHQPALWSLPFAATFFEIPPLILHANSKRSISQSTEMSIADWNAKASAIKRDLDDLVVQLEKQRMHTNPNSHQNTTRDLHEKLLFLKRSLLEIAKKGNSTGSQSETLDQMFQSLDQIQTHQNIPSTISSLPSSKGTINAQLAHQDDQLEDLLDAASRQKALSTAIAEEVGMSSVPFSHH